MGLSFLPGIWGTVSDWVMVWVTAITAIYLIKTFHKQQRLSEIEILKFKDSIKPKFETGVKIIEFWKNSDGSSMVKFSLKLYVRNSNAYNVKYCFVKNINYKNKFHEIVYENDYISFPIFTVKIDHEVLDFNNPSAYFYKNIMRIEFSDLENTKYFQPIVIVIKDNEETPYKEEGPVGDNEKVFDNYK